MVQDKLFLPGLRKLRALIDGGFFGRILSVRGEFGYWVFEGPEPPPQRPSWNYRNEDGGGILADMFCHWRYVLDNLFAPVRSRVTRSARPTSRAHRRGGRARIAATAEDAAYATFEIEGGIVAQMNSSWCVRVDRDELFELQVDGTEGSAVAGLRECRIQPARRHAHAGLEPRHPEPARLPRSLGRACPTEADYDNGFKVQWELFLRHVACDEPFPWDFLEAAQGDPARRAGGRGPGRERRASRSRSSRRERCATRGSRCRAPTARSSPTRPARPAPSSRPPRAAALAGVLRRRARGRRPARRRRPRWPGAARLGGHARLPPPPVVVGLRRGRGDGHRPARHGPRLGRRARADPPLRRRGAGVRRGDRRGRGHRPAAAAGPATSTRSATPTSSRCAFVEGRARR